MTVVLALLASLSWGGSDFLGGLAGRRSPRDVSVVVALWSQAAGLLGAVALVRFVDGVPLDGADTVVAIGAGFTGALGVAALYRGLRVGRMGVVAPITGALAASIPVVVGAVRGESPTALAWIGVVTVLVAIVLASRPAADHASSQPATAAVGVGWALAAGVGFGGVFVLLDAVPDTSGMWVFVPMKLVATGVLLAALLVRRERALVARPIVPLVVGVGVLDNAANVAFLLATRSGLLALAAVLSSLYPVVTVLLAKVVEHEHLARHQVAGLVLAIAGVVVIGAG